MSMRSFSRAGIIRQLFNTPLAVLPATAATVLGVVGPRFDVGQLLMHASGERLDIEQLAGSAAEARQGIEAKRTADARRPDLTASQLLDVEEGIAHINIRGELIAENGGGVSPSSGFTGYDAVGAAWAFAQRDPSVKGILLDIDTPGGTVTDLNELTAQMMADRGAKPSRAIIRGLGCSAGYAIACCADTITVQPLSYAGSIGVIWMHADFSEQLEQDGIKVTLVTAGAHKADGSPFEALPDAVRASMQANIDTAYALFVDHVAAARGMSADAVRATEARVYQGQQAVDAGLADKVMGWRDSQAEFVAAVNGRQPPATPKRGRIGQRASQEQTMADSQDNAGRLLAGVTSLHILGSAELAGQVSAALEAAGVEGVAVAPAEEPTAQLKGAGDAERDRITALVELCPESSLSASLTTAIGAGTQPGAFAIDLARSAKARGASLDDLKAGAVQPGQLPLAGKTATGDKQPLTGEARGKSILDRAAALGHSAVAHLHKI